MNFLFAIMIIRFLFSLLDNVPEVIEDEEVINNSGLVIHPAEFLLR